jgi:hypothetical protein
MTPWVLEAGDSLKRLLQGAAVGAFVTMIVGSTWGGWTLGSTVEKSVARARTGSAIVATLAPICVISSDRRRTNPYKSASYTTMNNF